MNVLFLTLSSIESINDRGIYTDLIRKIIKEGHSVFIVIPIERRSKQPTAIQKEQDYQILRVKTLNIQKSNLVEKGIGTLLIEHQFMAALKKFLNNVKFDVVIYSTPPITFNRVVDYIKNRDKAHTYLLLKDIFPQNAVDLRMIKKGGLLHRYFRSRESILYKISDKIGCMSPANRDYLYQHYPDVDHNKVHINPNCIEIFDNKPITKIEKLEILVKYDIPENRTLFIYGGNLGKPQGISFLIDIMFCYLNDNDIFFLIVGSGTEFNVVFDWFNVNRPSNALLLPSLPRPKFNDLLAVADVGLIFLDPRFTIPNFPSRLLSYLEFSLPVIAATDTHTDLGKIAQEQEFGFWCESGDLRTFCKYVEVFTKNSELRKRMGKNGNLYLKSHYTVDVSYSLIFG
jgi:glycosyltransferase involved in cell wall biosynthesis